MRRLVVGSAALVLGVALLGAAAAASAGPRQRVIFRYGTSGASVQIDPQLAYVSTAWWLEYATAAKLFNYPDRRGQAGALPRPEVASSFRVSSDGRTWKFTLRRGFRFSDGSPVTARSFAYAIDRTANHDLASPGAAFIAEAAGAEIVGARDVAAGKATHVRGVTARGYRLTIRLRRPSWQLPAILAMPFFQATSTKLPLEREVVSGYPSAGPYFFESHVPDQKTELRRNRYYGGSQPRHLDGVDVTWNVQASPAEFDNVPFRDADVPEIVREYGVNKSRFWVEPANCIGSIAFNLNRPLLRRNVELRRAINWALDRKAMLASTAPYSGSPWTHLLPPTFPGSVIAPKLQPYARAPDLAKARRLAAGHLRAGRRVRVGYRSSSVGKEQAQLFRDELVRLGIAPERIVLEPFTGVDSHLDFAVSVGWCSDYPEPFSLLLPLTPKYQRKLAAARRLPSPARYRALGRLDVELMTDLAPAAVVRTYNNRYLFSARVDPRSLVYEDAYGDWSIPALALK
jgi:ABC-type oligopeptide transport system substrate-binding subunit